MLTRPPTYGELSPGPEPYLRPVPVLPARHIIIENQEVNFRHAKDWVQSLVVYAPAHEVPKFKLAPDNNT